MFKLVLNKQKISIIAYLSFLILITSGFISTTEMSRYIVLGLRYCAIVLIVSASFLFVYKGALLRSQVYILLFYAFLVVWGCLLSILNNAFDIGKINLFIDFIIVLMGFYIISTCYEITPNFSNLIDYYFLIYCFVGLLITILFEGLSLAYPPHFNFSYASNEKHLQILYSQGISKFFGMAALTSLVLSLKSIRFNIQLIFYILTVIFLSLSLLGGARGDSLLAVLLCLLIILIKKPIWFIFLVLLSILVLSTFDMDWVDDFLIFQRLAVLGDGNLGQRDLLLMQSIDLLINEPRCLFIGCGFGYFQTYYGYDFGMYPHNILIESVIIYGLPLIILLLIFIILGIIRYIKIIGLVDLILMLYIYNVLIGLKSGYLLGSWLVLSITLLFISMPLKSIKSCNTQ